MTIDVFGDLETIPDQEPGAFDKFLEAVEPPGNYKKQETIDKWMAENRGAIATENYLKTGLTGLQGQICSVAFAVEDREIFTLTRGENVGKDDEKGLLKEFWKALELEIMADAEDNIAKQARANYAAPRWIGHNVLDFDLRFLKQRSIVLGVQPAYLVPADARHGSPQVYDTMKEWAGWRGYVKLDELVDALKLSPPDETVHDIDGSQVWDLFRNGEYETISRYNALDVWKVREIFRRMNYF